MRFDILDCGGLKLCHPAAYVADHGYDDRDRKQLVQAPEEGAPPVHRKAHREAAH